MLSFWEKNSFLNYEIIIVGGGIVGLSAAASLIDKYPSSRILVLEKGIFPTGASTKNAGFACFGSLTELLSDLSKMTENELLSLVNMRWEGLKKLQKRLGEQAIGLQKNGGYELITDKEIPALEHLDKINTFLKPIFPKSVFSLQNQKIEAFGFDKNTVKNLVFNEFEAQIDTGKMMRALWQYVQEKGVTIVTNVVVKNFEDTKDGVQIWLENQDFAFNTRKMIVATNAFTSDLIPDLDISAGRGQVLITSPIPNLKFKGVFHLDEGYYYFRNYGDRVLFGGGRNLDFEGETTTKFELTDLIMNSLEEKLKTIILPHQAFEITDRWAGIMAFGKTKQPILKFHSPNVLLAVRMGGMGVAIGSHLGEEIAEKIVF